MNNSRYIMHLNPQVKMINIYAKQNFGVNRKTWELLLTDASFSTWIASYMYQFVSTLFAMTICCLCCIAFNRFITNRDHMNRVANINSEEIS